MKEDLYGVAFGTGANRYSNDFVDMVALMSVLKLILRNNYFYRHEKRDRRYAGYGFKFMQIAGSFKVKGVMKRGYHCDIIHTWFEVFAPVWLSHILTSTW